jgi:uncharacterized protein YlxW (UPF0749 family)
MAEVKTQEEQIADFKEFAKTAITKAGNKIAKEITFLKSLSGVVTVKGKVLAVTLQRQVNQPALQNPSAPKKDAEVETKVQDLDVEWNLLGQAMGNAGFSLVQVVE